MTVSRSVLQQLKNEAIDEKKIDRQSQKFGSTKKKE